MSFAVFFETQPILGGIPQYLVFPASPTEVVIFHRVTDGGRTGLNRWSTLASLPVGEVLTREPSTLLVTANDVEQYVSTGLPSTLTTKALSAHAKAPIANGEVAPSDVDEWVRVGDTRLNRWLRDGRRSRPVNPPPVQVVAQPVAQPVVVSVPVTQPASVGDSVRMATVPDAAVAKKYIHRSISGVEDFTIFDTALKSRHNVLLYGPTGPGKTTSAIAFAADRNLPVFMVSGTIALEPSQLFGKYIPDGNGGFVWQDGGVTECVRHGGVLILDEVNFISSKIITVLFPLLAETRHITLLDHKGETIKAHPDLLIVGTMNPGYAGTQDLNAAWRNRFKFQIHWGYDDAVEKVLVPFKSLRDLAKQLRAAEAGEEIFTPTPTNALVDFVDIAKHLGIDFAVANFVARYNEDEQSSVELAVSTHRLNIEADLGITSLPKVEQVEESSSDDTLRTLADLDISL